MSPPPPATGISSASVPLFYSPTLIPLKGGRMQVSLWEGGGTQQGCCAAWEVNWTPPHPTAQRNRWYSRHTSQNYLKAQIKHTNEDSLPHRYPSLLGHFCLVEKVRFHHALNIFTNLHIAGFYCEQGNTHRVIFRPLISKLR